MATPWPPISRTSRSAARATSHRLVLGSLAGGHEQHLRRHGGARRMPGPLGNNDVFARELQAHLLLGGASIQNQRDIALEQAHQLVACRMALPGGPVRVERKSRDENVALEAGETPAELFENPRSILYQR